jgi:prepilin-type N-terminal cleavage/methylation domain-containing protein
MTVKLVHKNRAGFSLVELLVVVTIIAALVALTATATIRYIDAQNESGTRTTMEALIKILEPQWKKVVDDARKEPNISPAVIALAGGDMQRARVIWIKMRLMEAFPMNYIEANPLTAPIYNLPSPGAAFIPPGQQKYLKTYQITLGGASSVNLQAQSGACLLMALSINRGGAVINLENMGSFVRDTDADGVNELVDGWGMPFAFFRFPTPLPGPALDMQSAAPAKTGRTALFRDPLDPSGTLLNATWLGSPNGATFVNLVHAIPPPPPPQSFYIIPVIVSSGSDRTLGLNINWPPPPLPDMNVLSPAANDNLYSFQLQPQS